MIHFPVLRWGEPYESLEVEKVVHFDSGEEIAEVSQANAGLIARDMRKAQRARDALREIPAVELLRMVQEAGALFMNAELPLGDQMQSPEQEMEILKGQSDMLKQQIDAIQHRLEELKKGG